MNGSATEAKPPGLRIRKLTQLDLAFAESVRAAAGWNQTPGDWERFLETEPDGCFLAEWEGRPAGTVTTTSYGPDLAWIGMVLVDPAHRRRGIGRALLEYAIGHLRGRGVRCIKLDATPAGKLIYDELGFKNEWTLRRWSGVSDGAGSFILTKDSIREWGPNGHLQVEGPDIGAFGCSRKRLLAALAKQSHPALVTRSSSGGITGFGFSRPGSLARYLGPVVADCSEGGLGLVETILGAYPGQNFFWDIPDPNEPAWRWAEQHGFSIQRPLTRMYLGDNLIPGDPRRQFALAGPEVG